MVQWARKASGNFICLLMTGRAKMSASKLNIYEYYFIIFCSLTQPLVQCLWI